MSNSVDRLKAALAARYAVLEELGAGGMATVYLAEDLKHHRHVAIKVLRPELAAVLGPERFLQEIEVTAGLQHPHILSLHDSGAADGFLYYVMPYVEGETLRDRLNRDRQLAIEEAIRIAEQVGAALEYAHRHGVIHRDIKPENILLQDGEAIVADFGIALAVSAAGGTRLTETGLSLGTPHYMSPEQATADHELSPATDIYSLGCVLYEMFAGDPPHTGSTSQTIIAKILTDTPTRLSALRETVPAHVEAAVHQALSRAPVDRFATAGDFTRALRDESGSAIKDANAAGRRNGWTMSQRAAGVAVGIVAVSLVVLLRGDDRANWARTVALPEIARLADEGAFEDGYALALEAEGAIAGEPALDSAWALVAQQVTVTSEPSGAQVYRMPYAAADTAWTLLGTTPLEDLWFPLGVSTIRVELEGYRRVERAAGPGQLRAPIVLHDADAQREGVVWVPGGRYAFTYESPGLGHSEPLVLGDYLIDRYEVTNAQFKEFVDVGGYATRDYWTHPFEEDGRTIGWEAAMARFTDPTGRTGPSTWEVGTYPDGQDDYPVTGVSWYEAAAYARFVGRDLPTVYHWYRAAGTAISASMLPSSNLEGDGPAPVGASQAVTRSGAFDMAGNAREWAFNAVGDQRLILGGGWSDAYYQFALHNAQWPFDRSETNGFRLVTYLEDTATVALASRAVEAPFRDFLNETPVSDDVFDIFKRMYAYDPSPLNAVAAAVDTGRNWVREQILFDAAYGSEQVILYLYLPLGGEPPYQTVLYYPGSGVFRTPSFDQFNTTHADFVVKSGRAFAFPVYNGTFERIDELRYRLQDESNLYREHVIQWAKDLGRSIDYLETRQDLDTHNLAYFGHSWGGRMGAIMLAVEPRFKAAVLYVAGLSALPTQPEVEPLNFVTRVTLPVLMLSGRFDHIYPLASSAEPMFALLGTPAEDKRHVVSDGGHFVPRDRLIRETLAWLDRYLGPVR
ncbi:MAG: protein kinase [Gemmatimonadetes bacterium]|nr:protein kinase [Gemmatimonadota bacterium]